MPVFPLPENAAVDHMRIIVGERIIEGKIKERKQAKQIYETAKREGKGGDQERGIRSSDFGVRKNTSDK